MPQSKRYPRERFTRSLIKLCELLDASGVLEVDYISPDDGFTVVQGRLRIKARALWVFGSWSQGAPDCRDLDIAMDIAAEWVHGFCQSSDGRKWTGDLPSFSELRKILFRASPHVHFLDAKSILDRELSEGAAVLPDMLKPIWLAPDLTESERETLRLTKVPFTTWRNRIDAISINPDYVRVPRETDEFPLHLEQTGMYRWDIQELVKDKKNGVITWTFLPHGENRHDSPELQAQERSIAALHIRKDMALVARAIVATRDQRKRYQHVQYLFGNRCVLWVSQLNSQRTPCIVITPTWSGQGPNGSLVIERGPNYSYFPDLS